MCDMWLLNRATVEMNKPAVILFSSIYLFTIIIINFFYFNQLDCEDPRDACISMGNENDITSELALWERKG